MDLGWFAQQAPPTLHPTSQLGMAQGMLSGLSQLGAFLGQLRGPRLRHH